MPFKYQIRNCRLQTLSVWKGLKFVVWGRLIINIHTRRLCPWVYRRHVYHMDISHFRLPDCATDKKYLSLIGRSQNSSVKQNSTNSIQWLMLRQEFMCLFNIFSISLPKILGFIPNRRSLYNVGARNLIGRMKQIVGYLGI